MYNKFHYNNQNMPLLGMLFLTPIGHIKMAKMKFEPSCIYAVLLYTKRYTQLPKIRYLPVISTWTCLSAVISDKCNFLY